MVLEITNSLLGILLAGLAAVGFAGQFLCIRLGTDTGMVSDAVLVVSLSNVLYFFQQYSYFTRHLI